jgi:MerR family transcriptional regulator, mercuric resistance operon regulatory protein
MAVGNAMPIGVLAKRAGVQVETIRYYESEGLLRKPGRTAGGYRMYRGDDVERLNFIRRARELGFRLDAVRRLLDLTDRKSQSCDEVRELACTHLTDVRAKLADLRRMERALSDLVKACTQNTIPECALLQALARPR